MKRLFEILLLLSIISCNSNDSKLEQLHAEQQPKDMKHIIESADAPAPIGPYSQAVLHGNTLYVSGQIAIDPATGNMDTNDVSSETERVMKNLKAVLAAADMDFTHVVKCSIFLSDMNSFSAVNDVYGRYFTEQPPARETVAVKTLPKNVNVEISCIAVK